MPERDSNDRRRDQVPRGAIPPPAAYARLRRRFGVGPDRLSNALHKIKHIAGLPPSTDTLVDDDGNVYVAATGEWVGNLTDERETTGGNRMSGVDDPTNHEADDASGELVVLSTTESAENLAAAIGIPPDQAWDRGQPRRTRGLVHKFSAVTYASRAPRTARPEAHLDDLLVRLAPAKDRIAALASRLRDQDGRPDPIRLWVTHFTSNGSPGYDFSPEQIRLLAEMDVWLGVSIDVDDATDDRTPAADQAEETALPELAMAGATANVETPPPAG